MDKWIKAGKITSEVREHSKSLVKPGAKLWDIADAIEAKIRSLGAVPAFPVNLSMNEIAAHYTPVKDDSFVLSDQIIKVDIGVCYEGAIGDTAYTVDLSGRYSELVKASEEALKNALAVVQVGATLGEIGRAIQETISSYGYSPIRNLSGHGLSDYSVHNPPTVPNFDTGDTTELQKGQKIAIEPFATTGAGMIKESSSPMIYSQLNARPVRSPYARDLMKEIQQYKGLPFATRWLAGRTSLGIRELMLAGNLRAYPPLVEVNKGMVTQAEHSVIVDDKVVVTTE